MKRLGIGYTLFEFEGDVKRPIMMEKVHAGNLARELHKIEQRIKKLNQERQLFDLMLWAAFYGYSIRVLLSF